MSSACNLWLRSPNRNNVNNVWNVNTSGNINNNNNNANNSYGLAPDCVRLSCKWRRLAAFLDGSDTSSYTQGAAHLLDE